MTNYDEMSQDEYDNILADLVFENARTLLSIPGVYEAVSEHFNDEILTRWEHEHPEHVASDLDTGL